ncbi:MAG: aldo/keto reductase [Pseudomonadota bacterium]|nr:aldo/keto reductase [Pseudomonadota bacterium]
METRKIGGEEGFDISIVGLGCNAFGRRINEEASKEVIKAALEAEITFFDTAENYGGGLSEEFIGNALKDCRHEVILATKFGLTMQHVPGKGKGTRENIMAAIDLSLKKLRTDHVDLYQIHTPDSSTPIEETLGTLNDLVTVGKIRLFGCSNFSGMQLEEAQTISVKENYRGFVTAQNCWNVLDRGIETDLKPICNSRNVKILPYYPIAKGLLTGKYRRGADAPKGSRLEGEAAMAKVDFRRLEELEKFSNSRGFNLLTLAISWLSSQKITASVIAGATRREQLAQNAAAADWKMDEQDLAMIDKILG